MTTLGLTEAAAPAAATVVTVVVANPDRASQIVQTTIHGGQRIAGEFATRGGVLSSTEVQSVTSLGRTLTQADGAMVYIQKVGDRFNVVVQGDRGIITTFKNLSQKSLDRLGKNYGWK